MATNLKKTRTGLLLECDVSRRPVPRPKQIYPAPAIPVIQASLFQAQVETVAESGRKGIRITSRGSDLPGGPGATWTLLHTAYQGAAPSEIHWEELAVTRPKVNLLLDQALSSATHRFKLRMVEGGQPTYFPEVSVLTPADVTLADIQTAATTAVSAQATAVAASNAAANAQTTANALTATVNDITADDKITASEKTGLKPSYDNLMAEQGGIDTQADSFAVSRVSYDTNLNNLASYATSVSLWASMTATTDLGVGGGPVFRGYITSLLNAKQALLNAIAAKAKALADAAQTTATTATTGIATLANDDILSRAKKPQAITDYNTEIQTRAQLQAAALACVPQVSHATYTAAVDALASTLNALAPAWTDLSQDTPLGAGGGATLRTRWSTIAQQRTILQNSISQAQATKASNDAISAAATDAANKVAAGLVTAANDATAKANQAKQDALTGAAAAAGLMAGTPLYVKGTGANRMASRSVKLGSTEYAVDSRGLRLVWIRRSDLVMIGQTSYDTYASATDRAALAAVLNGNSDVLLACLTSYDAIGWDANLIAAVNRCGGNVPADAATGRTPYALIGIPGIGKGKGLQAFSGSGATDPYAEVSTHLLAGGTPVGMSSVAAMAVAIAEEAKSLPQFANFSVLPVLPSPLYPAKFGPVFTQSDASLWKVNDAGTNWDRIQFAATGLFGKVIADQIDITDTLRAAIVDAPHVKTTLLTVMSDATASGPGGAVQIGSGGIRARSIAASNMVIGGAGGALNSDPMCQDIGSWLGPGISIATIPWGRCGKTALCCASSGNSQVKSSEVMPIDITKTYRISAWAIRDGAADGSLFLGLALQDGAGNNITGNGTFWYVGAIGATLPPSTWVHFQGTIGPAGSGADLIFTGAEKTAQMLALPNYLGTVAGAYYIQDFRIEEVIPGELIVNGGIFTKKLSATASSTTNFTQAVDDVNGGYYASAGACMMTNTPGTPAMIVDSAGLKIGKRVFTDYWFRLLNAIDGSYGSGLVVWRGNIDQTFNGGAPLIADTGANPASYPRLLINTVKTAGNGNYNNSTSLHFQAQPLTNSDNLDALSHVDIVCWQKSGTSMVLEGTVACPPISSRRYKAPATPSDPANAGHGMWLYDCYNTSVGSAPVGLSTCAYPLILQCKICNTYGESAQHYFLPPSAVGNGATAATGRWTNVGTAAPYTGGGTGGGGGGGGGVGGGGCPAPWVLITLASGLTIAAGSLVDGMQVVGVEESTMEPAMGIVREPHTRWVNRVRVVFEDGRAPEFTDTHRFAMTSGGWVEARNLKSGDLLVAQRESRVKAVIPMGKGQVISFVVEGCHTYFSDDILSHNVKIQGMT